MAERVAKACSEATLSALFEASGEALMAFDASGAILCANGASARMLGRPGAGLVGESVTALGVPELQDRVERAVAGGPHATGRFRITLGERILACHTSRPRRADGATLLTMTDETEPCRGARRNRAVLAATADGLVLLSPDDTVTYVNPAAYRCSTPRRARCSASASRSKGCSTSRRASAPPAGALQRRARLQRLPDCPAYDA